MTNDLLTPPAERDLPPGRAIRMRHELLAATRAPRPHPPRWRWVVAAAAALTLLAGLAVTAEVRRERATEIVAMGQSELDPQLRRAAQQCLEWRQNPGLDGQSVPLALGDVAVAARHGGTTALLFLTDAGYLGCEVSSEFGAETSGGISGEAWPHRDWLPGPVQILSLTSSEYSSGKVTALGRISPRVHRLVLEHGNGRSATTARLSRGAFGLVTRTDDVGSGATLVSYDSEDREIGRRELFRPFNEFDRCYTDPAGTVVYGRQGPDCVPADPWER